jgi:legumain
MHVGNKYSKMILYVEACESGSMFNKILASDLSVYAVTASTPFESSFACYEDNYAHQYIGDCFSNHVRVSASSRCATVSRCDNLPQWMENSDASDWATETLAAQFNAVHDATNTSTVCAYGDLSIANITLAQFFGVPGSSSVAAAPRRHLSPLSEPVSSRDVPIKILQRKVMSAASSSEAALAQSQLQSELSARAAVDQRFATVALVLAAGDDAAAADLLAPLPRASSCTDGPAASDFECAEHAFDAYSSICGGFTDYSLQYFKVLRRACASQKMANGIEAALQQVC